MYSPSRKFLWYLVLIVLLVFVFKSPVIAGHLAKMGGELLSAAAGTLAKLVRAI
jgi:hypothetical protein